MRLTARAPALMLPMRTLTSPSHRIQKARGDAVGGRVEEQPSLVERWHSDTLAVLNKILSDLDKVDMEYALKQDIEKLYQTLLVMAQRQPAATKRPASSDDDEDMERHPRSKQRHDYPSEPHTPATTWNEAMFNHVTRRTFQLLDQLLPPRYAINDYIQAVLIIPLALMQGLAVAQDEGLPARAMTNLKNALNTKMEDMVKHLTQEANDAKVYVMAALLTHLLQSAHAYSPYHVPEHNNNGIAKLQKESQYISREDVENALPNDTSLWVKSVIPFRKWMTLDRSFLIKIHELVRRGYGYDT